MAPHQAFTIWGLGSVRGNGEGAVGSGRSCLVMNSEFTVPLTKELEAAVFMDIGTDMGSALHVPGNRAVRQGKSGFVELASDMAFASTRIWVSFGLTNAINAFQRKTAYFGINNLNS